MDGRSEDCEQCSRLTAAIHEALEEAEKQLCRFCREGSPVTWKRMVGDQKDRPYHVFADLAMSGEDLWWPCDAAAIAALREGR